MEFENAPKGLLKRELKGRVNPFATPESQHQFRVELNQQLYNNLHKCIRHVDLRKPENIEAHIEYEITKFRELGRDFYNEQERASIEDEEDLRAYIIKRAKAFFEMRDFKVAHSSGDASVDVLTFQVFSRNPFLEKITRILTEFVHYRYPEVEVSA